MLDYGALMNETIQEIKPSGIRKFFDLANSMEGVISLGVGEPDFKTPLKIREAAKDILDNGSTRYSANAGMAELRIAIADYLKRRVGLTYDALKELFVTVGGSEAIDLAIRTMVRPGDEVLVVTPCFVCYSPIVAMAGGIPVEVATYEKDDFKLTPEILKAAITPKTKMIVLPYPSNPTGAVLSRPELEALAEIIKEHNLIVLSDEIYSELTFGDARHVSIASLPGMWERTIVVNGFSKSYSMTGWRLGYVCAPAPIIAQMLKLHQYAIMCAPTVSQFAAITAVTECDNEIEAMRDEYDNRRKMMVTELNAMGLSCFEPKGAFYVFPSIKSTGMSSEEFCTKLLEAKKVAVVPGNAFGAAGEGYVRIAYSYSVEHLKIALAAIRSFLEELK